MANRARGDRDTSRALALAPTCCVTSGPYFCLSPHLETGHT